MSLDRQAQALLDALEDRELVPLAWGFVNGAFDQAELDDLAAHAADGDPAQGRRLVDDLMSHRLLFELPFERGRYRTRFAETVRLLASLRLVSGRQDWQSADPLVCDYRLFLRARSYPAFRIEPAEVLARVGPLPEVERRALTALLGSGATARKLAGFQVDSLQHLRGNLAGGRSAGLIVTAGTASGKTLAAYLPALVDVAARVAVNRYWAQMLCLYPRNELLKDQLGKTLGETERLLGGRASARPVLLGAFFQSTPFSADYVSDTEGWERVGAGYVCPFLRCPRCGGTLVWQDADRNRRRERLVCASVRCGEQLGEDRLVLTRQRMKSTPPDLLFTSTESLNRQLAHGERQRIFGVGQPADQTPRLVLLDEVHTYENVPGAQVALLLRRWRHAVHRRPVQWVGLSATLRNPAEFLAQLTGLAPGDVRHVSPADEEPGGREYLIALRGDPASKRSLLSTTIQTGMLLGRALDPQPETAGQQLDPPSDGTWGRRAFLFSDDLDVTNRLFHDLMDAEAFGPFSWKGAPLADLRAPGGDDPGPRDQVGQNWWMAEEIGHRIGQGRGLRVSRTSSQDRGVDALSSLVVCTAALEVGFDDDRVGAVVQHKAPHSLASFVQRKGRAGRPRQMRPWTVLVLSDYGRDRLVYQASEQVFDPPLPPRYLPLQNRHVLRMQAVFCLFDWLALKARQAGQSLVPGSRNGLPRSGRFGSALHSAQFCGLGQEGEPCQDRQPRSSSPSGNRKSCAS
jgi:hypothetical protein